MYHLNFLLCSIKLGKAGLCLFLREKIITVKEKIMKEKIKNLLNIQQEYVVVFTFIGK